MQVDDAAHGGADDKEGGDREYRETSRLAQAEGRIARSGSLGRGGARFAREQPGEPRADRHDDGADGAVEHAPDEPAVGEQHVAGEERRPEDRDVRGAEGMGEKRRPGKVGGEEPRGRADGRRPQPAFGQDAVVDGEREHRADRRQADQAGDGRPPPCEQPFDLPPAAKGGAREHGEREQADDVHRQVPAPDGNVACGGVEHHEERDVAKERPEHRHAECGQHHAADDIPSSHGHLHARPPQHCGKVAGMRRNPHFYGYAILSARKAAPLDYGRCSIDRPLP